MISRVGRPDRAERETEQTGRQFSQSDEDGYNKGRVSTGQVNHDADFVC